MWKKDTQKASPPWVGGFGGFGGSDDSTTKPHAADLRSAIFEPYRKLAMTAATPSLLCFPQLDDEPMARLFAEAAKACVRKW